MRCSGLRIWCCHCSSLGHHCDVRSAPRPGTSTDTGTTTKIKVIQWKGIYYLIKCLILFLDDLCNTNFFFDIDLKSVFPWYQQTGYGHALCREAEKNLRFFFYKSNPVVSILHNLSSLQRQGHDKPNPKFVCQTFKYPEVSYHVTSIFPEGKYLPFFMSFYSLDVCPLPMIHYLKNPLKGVVHSTKCKVSSIIWSA